MLENQVIRFRDPWLSIALQREVLPVCIHLVPYDVMNEEAIDRVVAIDENGEELLITDADEDKAFELFGQDGYLEERFLTELVPVGKVFLVKVRYAESETWRYSQPLVRVPRDGLSYVYYRCNEDAFGFPFATYGASAGAYLPIHLSKPQNVQEDKTYIKANGEVVTLYAQYYKEWEGETEYLSEEMHDKIVAALSCDEVVIDSKRYAKSDNYTVDWDNYTIACDGKTKLARATFKVREHITQRNSNY